MRAKSVIGILTFPVMFLLLCAMSGCNSLPFSTGINGVAIVETSGGNVNPPPPPTSSPFAGAIITVQPASGGQQIAKAIADANGGFRIELPPGTYLLVAQVPPDQRFVLAPPQQSVVVLSHELTQVVVTYSTVSHF